MHGSGERDLIGACRRGSSLSSPPSQHVRPPLDLWVADERKAIRTITDTRLCVTVGVDTHRDQQAVVALDARGAEFGLRAFPTTPAGHRELLAWLRGFGTVERCGVEGTGAYGASLTRYLHAAEVAAVEVNRPSDTCRSPPGSVY